VLPIPHRRRPPAPDYGSMDSDPGYVDPALDPKWGDVAFCKDYESSIADESLCVDERKLEGLILCFSFIECHVNTQTSLQEALPIL
jgi:hypothetical protein